jgi:hypothetical protein
MLEMATKEPKFLLVKEKFLKTRICKTGMVLWDSEGVNIYI